MALKAMWAMKATVGQKAIQAIKALAVIEVTQATKDPQALATQDPLLSVGMLARFLSGIQATPLSTLPQIHCSLWVGLGGLSS
jgi:hypothetical protein